MKTKSIVRAVMGLAVVSFVQGCTPMSVGRIDGFKAYLMDTAEAESVAVRLKDAMPDANSQEYRRLRIAFDSAGAASNGWLEAIEAGLDIRGEFQVTLEAYGKSEVCSRIKDFLEESRSVEEPYRAKTKFIEPAILLGYVNIMAGLMDLADKAIQMNEKNRDKTTEIIRKHLRRAHWTTFSNISEEHILKKHGPSL